MTTVSPSEVEMKETAAPVPARPSETSGLLDQEFLDCVHWSSKSSFEDPSDRPKTGINSTEMLKGKLGTKWLCDCFQNFCKTCRPKITVLDTKPTAEVESIEQTESKGVGGFLDANVYATKKSIAQGMLDVALLTANASQLKYLLQVGHKHEFYTIMVSLISTSIILQILIGFVLVVKYRFNINKEHHQWYANALNNLLVWMIFGATVCNILVGAFIVVLGTVNLNREKNHVRANVLNNMVTIFIFMITVVNIVISSFGMKGSDAPVFVGPGV